MKLGRSPLILSGVLVVAAIVLFVALKPGDSGDDDPVVTNSATEQPTTPPADKAESKPKPPPVPTVVVKNGEPVDGVLGIEVDQGDQITFKVESDVDDEIHVHGFDISKDVAAGGTTTMSFKADITGIFEAELEHSGVPIVRLQINP